MNAIRRLCVATAVCFAAMSPGLSALAQPASSLTGMWLAIDDGFPRLVAAGIVLPTEEVLHIAPDGRAESRLLTIIGMETHYLCATGWGCSDMLAIREAKAELTGGSLVFRNRETTADARKITREPQQLAANLTVIATSPQWVASFEAGGNRLRLETGSMTRIFARIDPERLNKLRAAPHVLDISYSTHWRCFLSNATANDRAFDPVGGARRAPGAWFEDFLMAAAEMHRLSILVGFPQADDPAARDDEAWAKSAGMQITHSIIGPAAIWPRNAAEKAKYRAQLFAVMVLAKYDDNDLARRGALELDPAYTGLTAATPAGLRALRKVMLAQYKLDVEVRDLFCLDRKDPPAPRPQYDPFRGVQLPK